MPLLITQGLSTFVVLSPLLIGNGLQALYISLKKGEGKPIKNPPLNHSKYNNLNFRGTK